MGIGSVQPDSELSGRDAELLEWFFGPGTWTFSRSTSGLIIERLEMYAYGSDPCEACNGTGFRGGWSYGDEAEKKRSRAEELAALLGIEAHPDKSHRDYDRDATCDACRGSCVEARTSRRRQNDEVTVWPSGEDPHGASYSMMEMSLQKYGIACRRLSIVATLNHRAAAVLEAFHGDWGARWAGGILSEGRIFAVYPFTPAGHKLIRMSRDKASLEDAELRPDEVLGVEFSLQRQQPNRRRGDLFKAAREQAKRTYAEACRTWNASASDFGVQQLALVLNLDKRRRDAKVRAVLASEQARLVNETNLLYPEAAPVAIEEIAS